MLWGTAKGRTWEGPALKLLRLLLIGLAVVMLCTCGGGPANEPSRASAPASAIARQTPTASLASLTPHVTAPTTTTSVPVQKSATATPMPTVVGIRISEWAYRFEDLEELEKAVDFVVVSEVAEVTDHTPDDSPTWKHYSIVQLRVEEDWSRSPIAAEKIVLQQPGSPAIHDRDDPPYAVGELYLLFLRRDRVDRGDLRNPPFAEPPVYRVISPQCRYRIEEGRLRDVAEGVAYRLNSDMDGRTLEAVRDEVARLQEVPKTPLAPWPSAGPTGP